MNRTSAEYVQNPGGPPSHHIKLGHPYTGSFNAMTNMYDLQHNIIYHTICSSAHEKYDWKLYVQCSNSFYVFTNWSFLVRLASHVIDGYGGIYI